MGDIIRARKYLKIGAQTVAPGTDVTAQAVQWDHLAAWIRSGRLVVTQTLTHYQFRAKQNIPEATETPYARKPYKSHRPGVLDVAKRYAKAVAATGATAGIPGAFTPAGARLPASPSTMAGITASPATAWTVGQYVQTATLGSAGQVHWSGSAWVAGPA